MTLTTRGRKLLDLAVHQVHRARAGVENTWLKLTAPKSRVEQLAVEREHWGEERHTGWLTSPTLTREINRLICRDPETYWLLFVKRAYFPDEPATYIATLGCGDGGLERNAFSIELCEYADAYDLAPAALDEARRVLPTGLTDRAHYIEVDLNTATLPAKLYDIIFAPSALHHLDKIEHALDQVRRALAPGGLFVVHEYVGPSLFQWTDAQLAAANDALASLPPEKRGRVTRIHRPPADATRRSSPFEAIRSANIVPLLRERFSFLHYTELGGGLLQPLLENIYNNFDENNPADRELLLALWRREKELVKAGVLENNFVFAVCRPR